MRSLQVINVNGKDDQNYSDLKVLKSAAGFYIGTIYAGEGYSEPGSRDSGYFARENDAIIALATLENHAACYQETHPNNWQQRTIEQWMKYLDAHFGGTIAEVGYRLYP
jgi:hypothetical protein